MSAVKKFKLLILIIISSVIAFLIFSPLHKENRVEKARIIKNSKIDVLDKNIKLNIIPKSISITRAGNPVRKKVVTSKEDMDKIMSYLKAINLKSKLNESYKGWSYSIHIEDINSNMYGIEIYGDKVSYNNSFYTTYTSISDKIINIYKELNYPEVDPLK